jgi:hypothetical protein
VLGRTFLLAVIDTTDYDVVGRYLLPGYVLLAGFAVAGTALLLRPAPARRDEHDAVPEADPTTAPSAEGAEPAATR